MEASANDATMTVRQAARRLGVKPATLYAYVSRGVLTSTTGPDGRTSLLDAVEIEALARRGKPRRASRETGLDIEIASAITSIDTEVKYRGHRQADLALHHTYEDVAELLWTGELAFGTRWSAGQARRGRSGSDPIARMIAAAASAPETYRADRTPAGVTRAGRWLIPMMVASTGPAGRSVPRLRLPGRTPLAGTVAGRLWSALTQQRPPSGAVRAMNALLVVLADHELAASTLSVRVAASTRADPIASVLAGLAVVSGPLHGAASRHAIRVLRRAAEVSSDVALDEAHRALGLLPGFGHRLYRSGDPRYGLLMPLLRDAWPRHRVWVHVDALEAAGARRGVAPNIDLSLAVLAVLADLPDSAGEAVFAVARTAGWLAHAAEEYEATPLRYRPRADYTGP